MVLSGRYCTPAKIQMKNKFRRYRFATAYGHFALFYFASKRITLINLFILRDGLLITLFPFVAFNSVLPEIKKIGSHFDRWFIIKSMNLDCVKPCNTNMIICGSDYFAYFQSWPPDINTQFFDAITILLLTMSHIITLLFICFISPGISVSHSSNIM